MSTEMEAFPEPKAVAPTSDDARPEEDPAANGLYGLFNVAAWLFVWRRMPELTGRSLEQIEGKLHEGRFRPKDFDRLARLAT